MSEEPHKKESLMDKILHHEHHDHHKADVPATETQTTQTTTTKPKESEFEKFKDYIKEDEAREQKGDVYGGLM